MSVKVMSGARFEGVDFGTASGTGHGYVVGTTPVVPMLHVVPQGSLNTNPAELIGMKYSHHDRKATAGFRAPCDRDCVRITMLVAGGPWRQKLWIDQQHWVDVRLSEPGDFVSWTTGVAHWWKCAGNRATMLTLTYRHMR